MFEEYPDVVSVEQLCKMLNVGKNTAYSLIHSGAIKAIRIGHQYRIPKKYIIEYLSS